MISGSPIAMSPIGFEDDEIFYSTTSRRTAVPSVPAFKMRADYVQPGGFVLWNDDSPVTWNDDTNVEWN